MNTKMKKSKKKHYMLPILAPDTEYLYYPLDVESATLKGSLLLAYIR